MTAFLWLIAIGSYSFAVLSFTVSRSDIQLIAAGVFATCGTVALVGASILGRLQSPKTPDTDEPTQ